MNNTDTSIQPATRVRSSDFVRPVVVLQHTHTETLVPETQEIKFAPCHVHQLLRNERYSEQPEGIYSIQTEILNLGQLLDKLNIMDEQVRDCLRRISGYVSYLEEHLMWPNDRTERPARITKDVQYDS